MLVADSELGTLFSIVSDIEIPNFPDISQSVDPLEWAMGNELGYMIRSTDDTCLQWYYEPDIGDFHGQNVWHYWTIDIWNDELPNIEAPKCVP